MVKQKRKYFTFSQIIVLGTLFPITFLFLDAGDVVDFRAYFAKGYEWVFKAPHEKITSLQDVYTNLRKALTAKISQEERIAQLERQVIRQQLIIDNLLTAKEENARLQNLLTLQQGIEFDLAFARIVGYDPENHFTTLIINKGANEGVKRNQPVLTYANEQVVLVGFILRAEAQFSEIRTILDQRTQISVKLASHNSLAIAKGQSRANILLEIDFIDISLENLLYETVATSGLGQRYPPGIMVGQIVEVEHAKYGLFQKAYLKPVVNFYTLTEIFVLIEEGEVNFTPPFNAETVLAPQ